MIHNIVRVDDGGVFAEARSCLVQNGLTKKGSAVCSAAGFHLHLLQWDYKGYLCKNHSCGVSKDALQNEMFCMRALISCSARVG